MLFNSLIMSHNTQSNDYYLTASHKPINCAVSFNFLCMLVCVFVCVCAQKEENSSNNLLFDICCIQQTYCLHLQCTFQVSNCPPSPHLFHHLLWNNLQQCHLLSTFMCLCNIEMTRCIATQTYCCHTRF